MPRGLNKRRLHAGMIMGRLTILHGPIYILAGNSRFKIPHWICKCVCGNEIKARHHMLARGTTQSCGCLQRERTSENRYKHGESKIKTSEWIIWNSIKQRCKQGNNGNDKHRCYIGIKVCERWVASFNNFLADMGRRPSASHSIERKDYNGDYDPSNCKWATAKEQAANKRNNINLTYAGETLCAAEWSRKIGVDAGLIRRRLRDGWTQEEALGIKSKKKGELISA